MLLREVFGLPKQLAPMLIAAVAVGYGIVMLTREKSVVESFFANIDGTLELAEASYRTF